MSIDTRLMQEVCYLSAMAKHPPHESCAQAAARIVCQTCVNTPSTIVCRPGPRAFESTSVSTRIKTSAQTIGIGAGSGTAGQVLVLHDMLGMNLGKMAKFVHNFMPDAGSVRGAMEAYVRAVKAGTFPDNALHAW